MGVLAQTKREHMAFLRYFIYTVSGLDDAHLPGEGNLLYSVYQIKLLSDTNSLLETPLQM